MSYATNKSKIPFADADDSATGDWLRLTVMLLLLLVGRSVIPQPHAPKAANKPQTHDIEYFFAAAAH